MMAARKAAKPRTQPPTNQPPASEIFHLAAFSSDFVPAFLALEIIASPNCAGGYGEIKYKEKP